MFRATIIYYSVHGNSIRIIKYAIGYMCDTVFSACIGNVLNVIVVVCRPFHSVVHYAVILNGDFVWKRPFSGTVDKQD